MRPVAERRNLDDMRGRNRAAVVTHVRSQGSLSRTELASASGLSHSTISAITAALVEDRILLEVVSSASVPTGRRGRPQVALGLDPQAACAVTVVLSLNLISVALFDYAGNQHAMLESRTATQNLDQLALMADIGRMIGEVLDARLAASTPLARIAVAVQGVTDAAARRLLWSPITPLTQLPLADHLEERFGVPVSVDNDCNMIALALRARDPERFGRDFVAILLSHGIGMGLVLRGEVFPGTRSSAAEFGHIVHVPDGARCRCGRSGCVEAYASNYAIWRNARGRPASIMPEQDVTDDDIRGLIDDARAGDIAARNAFEIAGRAIGFGLGSLFALIDPAPVALIGSGASAFELIEPAIRKAIAQTAGGAHGNGVAFIVEQDEMPLIRMGCAAHALAMIDAQIVSRGGVSEPRPAA